MKPIETDWLQREDRRLAQERQEREAAAERARQEAVALEQAALKAKDQGAAQIRAQAAADAAQQAARAAAAVPQRAQTRGSYGAAPARSLRTTWRAELDGADPQAILKATRHYRNAAELRDVLLTLANRDARTLKERAKIPGMKITSTKE